MTAIGFRAEKDRVHWAVVKGTIENPVVEAHDCIKAPTDYEDGEALSYFHNNIIVVLEQYNPDSAAMRYGETFLPHKPKPSAVQGMYARGRVEGVVIEAAHSRGIAVKVGTLQSISSRLGTKSAKKYLENGDVRGLKLNTKNKNRKEAILTAVSALGTRK